jgi:hypothetical protein
VGVMLNLIETDSCHYSRAESTIKIAFQRF